jgi:hypothetical protein
MEGYILDCALERARRLSEQEIGPAEYSRQVAAFKAALDTDRGYEIDEEISGLEGIQCR